MPTRIMFIGGEKIDVTAEPAEVAQMLSEAGVVEVERADKGGQPTTAYFNPAHVLYVEQASSKAGVGL